MEEFESIKTEFKEDLKNIDSFEELEELEQKYFGRKDGVFTESMKQIEDLSDEKKAEFGKAGNETKQFLKQKIEQKKEQLEQERLDNLADEEAIDVTRSSLRKKRQGHSHPISKVMDKMQEVARSMGFIIEDGPELESKYFNFDVLNIPPTHPSRETQDTFYIEDHSEWCMRSHVSNLQARIMDEHGLPLRAAYQGRCFRNEAVDASHEHTFYQFEGLLVDKNISIGHCIGVIEEILNGLFDKNIEVRVRPGYFPFTEPSFEMDMSCILCDQKGCSVCDQVGWIELLGAGLVHPNVIENAGYDPEKWSGLAFGMGLDRLVMVKYGIEDIRHFQSGDLRFLQQF